MYNFEYVSKKFRKEMKLELMEIFNLVQDEVRDNFTFRYDFIGSEQLNMVTADLKSNVGFDFDVNIRVNDDEEDFNAFEIKNILMKAFNKVIRNGNYSYDYCEDSTRVFTIKVKDIYNSTILHSCDIAVVYDCEDGQQQYIRHNKNAQTYTWEYQPDGYYQLPERIEWLKDEGLWQEVRNEYLLRKNRNNNPNKKSRALRAETINNVFNKYHN